MVKKFINVQKKIADVCHNHKYMEKDPKITSSLFRRNIKQKGDNRISKKIILGISIRGRVKHFD